MKFWNWLGQEQDIAVSAARRGTTSTWAYGGPSVACRFCGGSSTDRTNHVSLYRSTGFRTFMKMDVTLPMCWSCKARREVGEYAWALVGLVGFILGLAMWDVTGFVGFVALFFLAVGVGGGLYVAVTRGMKEWGDQPEVKALLTRGWSFQSPARWSVPA